MPRLVMPRLLYTIPSHLRFMMTPVGVPPPTMMCHVYPRRRSSTPPALCLPLVRLACPSSATPILAALMVAVPVRRLLCLEPFSYDPGVAPRLRLTHRDPRPSRMCFLHRLACSSDCLHKQKTRRGEEHFLNKLNHCISRHDAMP